MNTRWQMRVTSGALVTSLLAAGLLLPAAVRADESYALGPEDRLRLKVFEWRASRDETFSWEPLNDEYAIGSAGELSLPLAGKVQAAGLTRDELADRVSQQLSDRLGLGRRPSVAVEIVEYRPFYILGPVATPGAYPYRPGLTVLRAVSLAGGLGTQSEDSDRSAAIMANGQMEILLLERDTVRARIARLQAELDQAEAVEPPPELAARMGDPAISQLIAREQAVFFARRDAYRTKLAALEQLLSNLQSEVPAQRAMLDNVAMQVKSLSDDLNTISSVVATMQARSMEREVAKLEGERLRVQTVLMRAQQEVSRAELSIIELRTQRAQDLAADLREAYSQLEQAQRKITTTADLIEQAARENPWELAAEGRTLTPAYSIVRDRNGQSVELPADEATAVLPGDAIKVVLRRLRGTDRDDAM